MKDAAATTSFSAPELHAALLDYFSAPGKFQLTLRQPALLFSFIPEILHIAAGRGAPADLPASQAAEVREAATFFIRAALLYPGADHYAVLGLPSRAEPVELKERYRLLMRLTHPDFATGLAGWPADAAVRVNRAYEVLSSPVARREYDEQIASAGTQRPAEPTATQQRRSVMPARRKEERPLPVNAKTAWALALAGVLVALGMLMPSADPVHLVQKTSTPRPAVQPPLQVAPRVEAQVPAAPMPAAPVVTAPPAPHPVAIPAPRATEPVDPPQAVARTTRPAPASVAVRREQAPAPLVARLPAPVAAPTSAPGPIPVPAAMGSAPNPAIAKITIVAASSPVVSPTLSEVQPLLTQLLQMLESGSGDQLLRLLEADARQAAGAQALSRRYEQAVGRGRPVHLSHVEFKGEPRDSTLVVTGRIRLHAGESTIGSHGEKFLVRAEFVSRGGKVMLTGLSGGVD